YYSVLAETQLRKLRVSAGFEPSKDTACPKAENQLRSTKPRSKVRNFTFELSYPPNPLWHMESNGSTTQVDFTKFTQKFTNPLSIEIVLLISSVVDFIISEVTTVHLSGFLSRSSC
ncbi:hypothetical protein P879_08645, partial [Paragonimus westermani]